MFNFALIATGIVTAIAIVLVKISRFSSNDWNYLAIELWGALAALVCCVLLLVESDINTFVLGGLFIHAILCLALHLANGLDFIEDIMMFVVLIALITICFVKLQIAH